MTLANDVQGTEDVDTDVDPGDTFQYRVRAVNEAGVEGPWSSPMEGTVPVPETATAGAPDKPILNAAPNTGKRREEILVSWTKPIENGSPIVSYTLEVSDTGREGSWSDSGATLGASATSWVETGLTGGTTRYYRLRATNMCDTDDPQRECHSLWSDAVIATTDPPGQSGPPTGVRAVTRRRLRNRRVVARSSGRRRHANHPLRGAVVGRRLDHHHLAQCGQHRRTVRR